MSKKYYLKLDGVRGESQNPRHYQEIELSSLSWGEKFRGVGGGTGKAQMTDLHVVKPSDTTSPILWVACTSGQNFRSGSVTIEDISEFGSMIRFVTITLKEILIATFRSDNGGDNVTLNFAEFSFQEGK